MKLGTFMTIAAVVAFVFGVGFLLAPVAVENLYGNTIDEPGQFLGRYLGGTFIGLAVMTWLAKNDAASQTRRSMLMGLFVLSALGFLVALYDKFAGPGNALVWLTVVIYLLLTLGFGYFTFMKTA